MRYLKLILLDIIIIIIIIISIYLIHINGCAAMPIPWPPSQTVMFACMYRSIHAYQDQQFTMSETQWALCVSMKGKQTCEVKHQRSTANLHIKHFFHYSTFWNVPWCPSSYCQVRAEEQQRTRMRKRNRKKRRRRRWVEEEEEGRYDSEALLQEKL